MGASRLPQPPLRSAENVWHEVWKLHHPPPPSPAPRRRGTHGMALCRRRLLSSTLIPVGTGGDPSAAGGGRWVGVLEFPRPHRHRHPPVATVGGRPRYLRPPPRRRGAPSRQGQRPQAPSPPLLAHSLDGHLPSSPPSTLAPHFFRPPPYPISAFPCPSRRRRFPPPPRFLTSARRGSFAHPPPLPPAREARVVGRGELREIRRRALGWHTPHLTLPLPPATLGPLPLLVAVLFFLPRGGTRPYIPHCLSGERRPAPPLFPLAAVGSRGRGRAKRARAAAARGPHILCAPPPVSPTHSPPPPVWALRLTLPRGPRVGRACLSSPSTVG